MFNRIRVNQLTPNRNPIRFNEGLRFSKDKVIAVFDAYVERIDIEKKLFWKENNKKN